MKLKAVFAVAIVLISTIILIPNIKAEDPTIVEQQTNHTYSILMGVPSTVNTVNQGFKTDINRISKIEIFIESFNGGTISAGIGYKTTNLPYWTWIGYEQKTSINTGWNTFDFTDSTVTPGNQYYIKVTYQGSNNVKIGWKDENPYSKGYMEDNSAGNRPNDDLAFKIWGYNTGDNERPNTPALNNPSNGATFIIEQGQTKDVTLKATATDPDGDDITYRFWDQTTGDIIGTTSKLNSGQQGSITWENLPEGTYRWYAAAGDTQGFGGKSTTNYFSIQTEQSDNNPPDKPDMPSGCPYGGITMIPFGFYAKTNDPDGDNICYRFDWGDGSTTSWTDFVPSGTYVSKKHVFILVGYNLPVRVQAKDENGAVSPWSDSFMFDVFPKIQDNENLAPNVPNTPTGPISVETGDYNSYSTFASDSEEDRVQYLWDIDGDYYFDIASRFYESGEVSSIAFMFSEPGIYEVRVKAVDDFLDESSWSNHLTVNVNPSEVNRPPSIPKEPTSVTENGFVRGSYPFSTWSFDPDNDDIQYFWDWGDGTNSGWYGSCESSETCEASHSYEFSGTYKVRVKARDDPNNDGDFSDGIITGWSEYLYIEIEGDKSSTIYYPTAIDPNRRYDGSNNGSYNYWLSTTDDYFQCVNNHHTGMIGTISQSSGFLPMPSSTYGDSWAEALIRKDFYIGREKNLEIEAEIEYTASTVGWMIGLISDFVKNYFVYHIDELTIESKVRKEINFNSDADENVIWGYIEALAAILIGASCLLKPDTYQNYHMAYESIRLSSQETLHSMIEENARAWVSNLKTILENYYFEYIGLSLSELIMSAGLVLLLASFLFYLGNGPNYSDLNTHFNELEKQEYSDTYKLDIADKTFTKGDHSIWVGLESKTFTPIFASGMAYTAGIIKNIKIKGISPPEKPTIHANNIGYCGGNTQISLETVDYNDDPVKYIIDWGDGNINTVTDFMQSGQQVKINHVYLIAGTYTIKVKAEDCDKMQSETKTHTITIIYDNNPPTVNINDPIQGLYFYDEQIISNYPDMPFIIGDITINADAYDSEGVKQVVFIKNGMVFETDTTPEYNAKCYISSNGLRVTNFKVAAQDYGGNEVIDDQESLYWNKGTQTMTASQPEGHSPEIKRTYNLKMQQPADSTETELKQGLDSLRNTLQNDYNGATITYTYEIDYGDETPVETIESEYPLLQITHQYQDDKAHTITITLTTTLNINSQTYTHEETYSTKIGSGSGSKTTLTILFEKLSEKFVLFGKILDLILQIKERKLA